MDEWKMETNKQMHMSETKMTSGPYFTLTARDIAIAICTQTNY